MPAERWLDQDYKKHRFCGEGITRARPCSSNVMLGTRTGTQGNPAPRTTEHRRSNIHGASRGGFTIARIANLVSNPAGRAPRGARQKSAPCSLPRPSSSGSGDSERRATFPPSLHIGYGS